MADNQNENQNPVTFPEGVDLENEAFSNKVKNSISYLGNADTGWSGASINHIPETSKQQYLVQIEEFKKNHTKGSLAFTDAELANWSDEQINALLEKEANVTLDYADELSEKDLANGGTGTGPNVVDSALKTGVVPETPFMNVDVARTEAKIAEAQGEQSETEGEAQNPNAGTQDTGDKSQEQTTIDAETQDTATGTATETKQYGIIHRAIQGLINRAAAMGIDVNGLASKFGFDFSKYGYTVGDQQASTQTDGKMTEEEIKDESGAEGKEDASATTGNNAGNMQPGSQEYADAVKNKLDWVYGSTNNPGSNFSKLPSDAQNAYAAEVEKFRAEHTQSWVYTDTELSAMTPEQVNSIKLAEVDAMNEWTDKLLLSDQETATAHLTAMEDQNQASIYAGKSSYLVQMLQTSGYVGPTFTEELQSKYATMYETQLADDQSYIATKTQEAAVQAGNSGMVGWSAGVSAVASVTTNAAKTVTEAANKNNPHSGVDTNHVPSNIREKLNKEIEDIANNIQKTAEAGLEAGQ